jgi:diguanylate cyclase
VNGPISFRFAQTMPRAFARELEEPESGVVAKVEPRLLVVEADRLDQAHINVLLRKAGFENAERDFVTSLGDAIELLKQRSYSHMLVNTGLTDLDPKVLLNELKTLASETAVIFLADHRSATAASELIRAGADDYVVKEELEGRTFRQTLAHATERKRSYRRWIHALQHDPVSGLPNWSLFAKHWAQKLAAAFQKNEEQGLLVLRLENFGRVVATLGTAQSQQVLSVIGEHLERAAGRQAAAHLGGERFIAGVALGTSGSMQSEAARILNALHEVLTFHAKGVPIVLRAGLALNSVAGPDVDNMLAAAHEAVEEAERLGSELQLFDGAFATLTERRRVLDLGLQQAIANKELSLHYQPKVDLTTGQVIGTEALMRWTRDGERIGPAEFVPLLERSGLIDEFGVWALHQACDQEARWRRAGIDLGSVAVNLSGRQFRADNLRDVITNALRDSGTPPERLQLELTESSLVGNVDAAVATMRELKGLGVKLGLDDFGTGYSSMAYLQHFPFDVLKIDRSFVMNLGSTHVAQTIAEGIVALGRALELYVVAEGVETVEQLRILRKMHCHSGQGYLFGRPLPPEELETSGWCHIVSGDRA